LAVVFTLDYSPDEPTSSRSRKLLVAKWTRCRRHACLDRDNQGRRPWKGPKMMAEICLTDAATQAKAALTRSRIFDLRRLVVVQDGDAVVLRGRVSSFYHKQLAQEVVRNATDGAEVINAIRVVYQVERRTAEFDRAG